MERLYLVLDSGGAPLAQAVLESPLEADMLQIRVLHGAVDRVTAHRELMLVGLDDDAPDRRGRIARVRGDRLVILPTAALGPKARENVRIASDFESYIYPVSGEWRGRRPIKGHDVSCGGVAFHCEEPLQVHEIVELVLPVTDEPLLLQAEILRTMPTQDPLPLYGTKFRPLLLDEELLIRKAVFSIEVSRPR